MDNLLKNLNTPYYVVIIGLPGSGKSTWVSKQSHDFCVISTDNIIKEIAEQQNKTYSETFRDNIKIAIKQMLNNRKNAIDNRLNIIHDQTNMGIDKRKRLISDLPKEYTKVALLFQIPDKELKKRLDKRAKEEGKYIPWSIIQNMKSMFEIPTLSEGFDKIIVMD